MKAETYQFIGKLIADDLSVRNLVRSDFTFLDERLAKHYGIEGVTGPSMRLVKLPQGSHRGGVITQASVLFATTNGFYTSPVLRGAFLLERVQGISVPPPPPDAPPIEPDVRGAATLREQLEKHRNVPACYNCHRQIDPPGFALENYDVLGRWRTHYRVANEKGRGFRDGKPVVAGGVLEPGGKSFRNIQDFQAILLEHPERLGLGVTERLLAFALGRKLSGADRVQAERIVEASRETDYGFRTLILDVATSDVVIGPITLGEEK